MAFCLISTLAVNYPYTPSSKLNPLPSPLPPPSSPGARFKLFFLAHPFFVFRSYSSLCRPLHAIHSICICLLKIHAQGCQIQKGRGSRVLLLGIFRWCHVRIPPLLISSCNECRHDFYLSSPLFVSFFLFIYFSFIGTRPYRVSRRSFGSGSSNLISLAVPISQSPLCMVRERIK